MKRTESEARRAPESKRQQVEARALPLIEVEGERFRVGDEALELLRSIGTEVSVISVAGAYRSGKSFLLNRVLLQRRGCFGVGSTINACTKGIWLWSEPLEYLGKTILILDTEGLGAFNATDTHDSRIFALALLLSSFFIYNSVGTIDESAISTLSLVANLSKVIRLDSAQETSSAELGEYFPDFLWLVRDFALQLRDEDGAPISSQQYLENALAEQTVQDADKNRLRSELRAYFPRRDCATLVRPCADENQLQRLDQLGDNQLRREFVRQAKELRARVFAACPVKCAMGRPISGALLAELCVSFAGAINSGVAPAIRDSWSLLVEVQAAKAQESALAWFHDALPQLPHSPSALAQRLVEQSDAAIERFHRECLAETDAQPLRKHLAKACDEIQERNRDACVRRIAVALNALEGSVFTSVRELEEAYRSAQSALFAELSGVEELWAVAALPPSWSWFRQCALESSLQLEHLQEAQRSWLVERKDWQHKVAELEASSAEQLDKLSALGQEHERERTAWLEATAAATAEQQAALREQQAAAANAEQSLHALQLQQGEEQLEVHRLTGLYAAVQAQLADARRELEHQEEASTVHEQELLARAQRIESLERDLAATTAALGQHREQSSADEAEFRTALDQLLRESNASLAEIKQAHSAEQLALHKRIKELEAAQSHSEEQHQVELRDARRLAEKATKALQRAEREAGELRAELEQRALLAERQLAAQAELKERFASELKELLDKQRADAQKSLDERTKLLHQMRELSTNAAVQELKVETLTQQLSVAQRRSETSQSSVQSALQSAELKRSENQVFELRQSLADAQGRVGSLEKQLRDQEREFAVAKMKLQMEYEVQKSKAF